MHQLLEAVPPWAPLVAAAIGLAGAFAALLYARWAIALACERLEAAHNAEQRLLRVIEKHPEILVADPVPQPLPEPPEQLEFHSDSIEAQELLRGSSRPAALKSNEWEQMALLLISQGRFHEAENICRQAIEIDPANAQAHNTLGVIYRRTQRPEAAAVACRQATKLQKTSVSAHINLGVALRSMGRLVQAEEAYRRAIELEPRHAVAHSSLGVALAKQGRGEEAEACYMKAIEIDPRYTPAWLNLAIALQKRNSLEEAQAAYRCALELGTAARETEPEDSREAAVA